MVQPASPPPGFYDAGDAGGRQRWWDGTTWTDHFRPPPPAASQPLPATSQPLPATSAVRTEVAAPQQVCPVCGSAAALTRIGAIIEQGTSTTTGRNITRTQSAGTMSATHFVGGSVGFSSGTASTSSHSVTRINEVTQSQIAARLMWPPPPRFDFKAWFLRWYLGLTLILGTLIFPFISDHNSVAVRAVATYLTCLLLLWIPALVIAVVQRSATASARARATATWSERTRRLVGAYYCVRDGLVVEEGRAYAADAFKAAVYGS